MRFDNERNNRNYGQNTCRTEYSTPLRYGNNYRPSSSYGQRSNNQQKKSYSADCSLLKVCYPEIPVGGRLKFFMDQWKQITKDKWVLTTTEKGYKLEFQTLPPYTGIRQTSVNPTNLSILNSEVGKLLEKAAIEPVPFAQCQEGFYSIFFLVPKKGELRPELNLRPLT